MYFERTKAKKTLVDVRVDCRATVRRDGHVEAAKGREGARAREARAVLTGEQGDGPRWAAASRDPVSFLTRMPSADVSLSIPIYNLTCARCGSRDAVPSRFSV